MPFTSVLSNWAAVIALWAPAYLALLDRAGMGSAARSEPLQWALLAVGAAGMVSVLRMCWRDTRDPAWRSAHGLAPRARAGAARH
jgi:hypothetical protein